MDKMLRHCMGVKFYVNLDYLLINQTLDNLGSSLDPLFIFWNVWIQ